MDTQNLEDQEVFFHTYISMYAFLNTPDNSFSKIVIIFYLLYDFIDKVKQLENYVGGYYKSYIQKYLFGLLPCFPSHLNR